jgi:hypothetical protein
MWVWKLTIKKSWEIQPDVEGWRGYLIKTQWEGWVSRHEEGEA